MATIQFKALGKKDPINLNMRFFHNTINCYAKSNIFIDGKDWSDKTNKIKQSASNDIKKYVNDTIDGLSKYVLESFKVDFPKGDKINTEWLSKQVDSYYGKPDDYNDYRFYFIPFVDRFINESKNRLNPKSGKKISVKTIQNYKTTLTRLNEFENLKGLRLRTKEIDLKFHSAFTSFLKINGKYSNTLIEKYVSHIKYFVKEAKMEGYETSIEIESSKFTFVRDKSIDTYLDVNEIDKVFNLDLSNNERLDNVRDLFIIGVWTGLRISDLKRLNEFKISNGRITIAGTLKGHDFVEIPIHPQLKYIFEKRSNVLPNISEQKFNLYIKEVCAAAGIDNTILGRLKNPATNRKEEGYYPKYMLISSHTCRRSFVSNHYGELDDKTIMAITTHKSHTQFLNYVKTTLGEHANKLEKYWENREELKKTAHKMKVV